MGEVRNNRQGAKFAKCAKRTTNKESRRFIEEQAFVCFVFCRAFRLGVLGALAVQIFLDAALRRQMRKIGMPVSTSK